MLHRSLTLHRASAFSLFQKHLGETGILKGLKNPNQKSAKMYRQLSTPERKIFEQRARRVTYPALDAYNRFQKEYAHRFLHLPMKQRQRKVAQLWAELKKQGTVRVPKSARRTIKKTAAAKKKKSVSTKGKKTEGGSTKQAKGKGSKK